MTTLLLHALPTNTLYHAEDGMDVNIFKALYTLVDEAGDTLVDEAGNILVSDWTDLGAPVIHALATNTLYHAES
jgi:hypothetical protein